MAVISKFHGIIIRMVCAHPFAPRFHAFYGPSELVVRIDPLSIVTGEAPAHVCEMVLQWAGSHQQELLEAWDNCRMARAPARIAPLS